MQNISAASISFLFLIFIGIYDQSTYTWHLQELERRATKTTNSIHRLGLDVDRTNVALGNVTNQLAALQHSQFVENRVYEDDETIANESEVPVSDESEVSWACKWG